MAPDVTPAPTVDLSNCDREPIHMPGTVQNFGFLLAVTQDWSIARVSDNAEAHLGIPCRDLLGKPLAGILAPDAVHAIRNRIATLRGENAVDRLFAVTLREGRAPFDLALHFSGGAVVIEAEPARGDVMEVASHVRAMIARLKTFETMEGFFRDGARQVQALTGFDRVMVYRFDAAGSGEVVAEALRPNIDSFLGLNYPASDIPAQARALYLRNIFRIIADVNAEPAAIHPRLNDKGEALDQSLSILRAVSPIHIEYLKNMGVAASLSISIIVGGRLWGLFACHHYAPLLPSFAQRSAAELFGQMFAMMLESRERRAAADYEGKARNAADRLMTAVAQDGKLLHDARWLGEIIFDTIPADGVGVFLDGEIALSGLTPSREEFARLAAALREAAGNQVFAIDRIANLLPEAASYANRAAGLLAIPVSRTPRDYVVLLRGERLRSVRWAGTQEKTIDYGPNGPRLTPRKSFEEWSQLVRGKAAPFTPAEMRVADSLRVALLEVVLRLADAALEERQRAHQKQELLIAELNHRVRNILALIRGLIAQSRRTDHDVADFIETLDSRVQALARAHDQITADRWGPASLIELIETESAAYLGDRRGRVALDGPNILIDPAAFTVMALVIHELMTNAAKYGALSDSGAVAISWRLDAAGNLLLDWTESGGPAVTQPTRRGFGSTIIERSIPHELGGQAAVSFRLAGLHAHFMIEKRYINRAAPTTPRAASAVRQSASDRPLAGKVALLVEDNMIIALDSEDQLRSLGAQTVLVAASVTLARQLLKSNPVNIAVLDFNLGRETSLPIATDLRANAIPFVFATGYGEGIDLPPEFGKVPVVKKPSDLAALSSAIRATLAT